MNTDNIGPVSSKERYIILDTLRGFALFGICLANFPEFSLYSFLKSEVTADMSWLFAIDVMSVVIFANLDLWCKDRHYLSYSSRENGIK